MARHLDATMGQAILGLYRSACDIGREWGPGIDTITGPGLLIAASKDPYRTPRQCHRLAERTRANVLELPDAGHFWMLEDPVAIAAAASNFWADGHPRRGAGTDRRRARIGAMTSIGRRRICIAGPCPCRPGQSRRSVRSP
jgi:hypothetical protein